MKDLTVSRSEQIWVSDITYIPTKNGNTYLSLITDGYSRKIVGHHLSEDLRTEGVAQALPMAIQKRKTNLPLIHHSDRGLAVLFARISKHFSCPKNQTKHDRWI